MYKYNTHGSCEPLYHITLSKSSRMNTMRYMFTFQHIDVGVGRGEKAGEARREGKRGEKYIIIYKKRHDT